MSAYADELTRAMDLLATGPRPIFLGQSVCYPGNLLFGTLQNVPDSLKLEFPVAENMQLGASIGLSLQGFDPVVSIFPRIDFLIAAMDQLVNHLDKLEVASQSQYRPRVIIRTMLGSLTPLYPGPQHCGDYTRGLEEMLCQVAVVRLEHSSQIMSAYKAAMTSPKSTILIEAPKKRDGYEED